MKKVYIYHDPFDTNNSTKKEVSNVVEYLKSEFKVFPAHARIFHKAWHDDNDITEKMQADENYADSLDGDIIVVIYPSEVITVLMWIYYAVVAVAAVASIYMFVTMPKTRTEAAPSSNNELAGRSNTNRLGGRIPEIFGLVRSYPDLIAETYTYYEDGVEVERSLLCIGRGYYEIMDFKDALTDVTEISGTSISAYDPNTSIVGTPIYQSGRSFLDAPLSVIKSPSITGQTLDYPNDTKVESVDLYFTYDGKIHSPFRDLTLYFAVGDLIMISGANFGTLDQSFSGNYEINTENKIVFESPDDFPNVNEYGGITLTGALVEITTIDEIPPVPPETEPTYVETKTYKDFSGDYIVSSVIKTIIAGGFNYQVFLSSPQSVNPNWSSLTENKTVDAGLKLTNNSTGIYLDGTYSVEAVLPTEITLASPSVVNSEWNDLSTLPNQSTQGTSLLINLDKVSNKWVGWHKISKEDADRIMVNLHFPQGIYRQNSKGGTSGTYTGFAFEYQVIDDLENPLSDIIRYDERFDGATRAAFGRTINLALPVMGSVRFRACRTRESNPNNEQATMNLKDVYLASESNVLNYDGVTVIQSEAIGSDGLYSIKDRKLNCLVTRKLPLNGTGALTATKSAAQALIYLALDDKNGRRTLSEVDIDQILAEEQAIINYFGNTKASEFSYTFDDNNLSFEEITGMICSTIFCEAYRYGSKLRMRFEADQLNSVLLFNHRNKAPNSETRSKTFTSREGFYGEGYDGIDVEYTSPDDDARINYVASDDLNPTNTMKIKTSGIRTHEQAKTRAWREWNKLKFRNISVEFEALDESNLLARMDRILVADNTLIKTTDGEVEAVDGLILELSQPIEQAGDYSIYLQLPDATVDIIPCSYVDKYRVQLTRMPLVNLAIGRAFYKLILNTSPEPLPFLMTELKPQSKMTNMLTCVNYDSRYYQNDHDFF